MIKTKPQTSDSEQVSLAEIFGVPSEHLLCYEESGAMYFADSSAAPQLTDTVLCESSGEFSLKPYSEIKNFTRALHLIARNGQTVESNKSFCRVEIIGVVTHVLQRVVRTEAK